MTMMILFAVILMTAAYALREDSVSKCRNCHRLAEIQTTWEMEIAEADSMAVRSSYSAPVLI